MSLTNELYQQTILEHNKNPRNYGKIPNPSHQSEGNNPLCGDSIHITLNVNQQTEIIEKITFVGNGCAISKASASIMTEVLKGISVKEANVVFESFRDLTLGQKNNLKNQPLFKKLLVFSGIFQYPSRVKCAVLAWHTFKNALEKTTEIISTENED